MLIQDVRFAVRGLLARPGFAAIAILTLSLGIGATTAIFTVVRSVLWRPLDYEAAERLVKITGLNTIDNRPGNLSPADFLDFARDSTVFARTGANGYLGLVTIAGGTGDAERIGGVSVTEGFFPTLGVEPAIGRNFTAAEDAPGGPAVAIISDRLWRNRYAASPTIVGSSIMINANPVTVVGVLPAGYRHLEPNPDRGADVFTTYQWNPATAIRSGRFIRGIGRLKDGETAARAQAELSAIAARLEQQYPKENTGDGVAVAPLLESMVGNSRPALLMLSAAVALVLLVACANVANLLLARGSGRMRELALRAAIGADRGQLIRQMLTESATLGVFGAAGGLVFGWWATRALSIAAAASLPRADQIRVDGVVLLFAIAAALLTSVVFGLVPALHLSRSDLQESLKEGGRHQGAVIGRGARELLITAEVALSIVLLVGAGLLVRSLWQLEHVNPGFDAARVLTMEVAPPIARYPEGDQTPFYRQLETRIAALPGVAAVGAVNILPLSNNYDSRGIQVEDRPVPEGQGPEPQGRTITAGYFRAMGIPLIRGRAFDDQDTDGHSLVAIISESMARKYWPGEDAVGKRFTYNGGISPAEQRTVGGRGSRLIVGIAGDVKHLGLDEGEVPMFYTPNTQQPSFHTMRVVVRAAGDPASLTKSIRGELAAIDREVPLSQVATLSRALDSNVAQPRLRAMLLGIFAALAMALAAIGVYGVVSYLVSQRAQEIGVRLALGARAADVLGMLVREAMRPVSIGIGAGVLGALALTRALQTMLFGVSTTDVTIYAVACGVLAAAALVASIVPARRALRVDAVIAIRGD